MRKSRKSFIKILSALMLFSSVSPVYAEEVPVDDPVSEVNPEEENKEKIDLSEIRDKGKEQKDSEIDLEKNDQKTEEDKQEAPAPESVPAEEPEDEAPVSENDEFSSMRLIVAADSSIIRRDDPVISEYNGIYLIQFETVEAAKGAFEYYNVKADFVEPDVVFEAAGEILTPENTNEETPAPTEEPGKIKPEESSVPEKKDPEKPVETAKTEKPTEKQENPVETPKTEKPAEKQEKPAETAAASPKPEETAAPAAETALPEENTPEPTEEPAAENVMNEEENPLTELAKEEESGISELGNASDRKHMVVALIDTGVNGETVGSVSMLGDDVADDNGHGTEMYNVIKGINPDVDILSIKALDSSGKGTASSILAAVEYARQAKVDVINLSLSAVGTAENSVVADSLRQAREDGIAVVGAAGNSHKNAKYYIPGGIDEAYIIGASKEDGSYADSSNFGETVDYVVPANSTSEAAAAYTGMLTYSLMNNVNIATYPYFSGHFFLAPEVLGNLANEAPDSTEGSFYAAQEVATEVIDAKDQGMLLSEALKLYENGNYNSDYVYAYRGTVGGAYNSSNYIGRYLMYHPEDTPGYDGCISNSTKTLRFWMPKVGTWKGRPIGAEVQYVDESSANSDPFSLDLKSPVDHPPLDDDHDSAQFGAFNVFARNSRQMHIYVTFYEEVNTSLTVPNGTPLTLNTEGEHIFYGGIGLSNELKINGTTEWTAPKDDSQAVYSYISSGEKPNIDRTSWVKDTYNGKTIYYQANSDTTDGMVVDHLANFLYDGKGQTTLELYVGFRGPGVQVLDDNYTSGMYGDPSIWYRLRFAYIAEGNYGMYVLDIDPNGGIYTDLTGEERAYQEENHSLETDDWYIEDSSYGNPITINDKLYDGLDGISIPTREGYAFDGWKIIYGPGHLRNGQSQYVFGTGNGKIQAQWRHYTIFTEVVNGQITSDNDGTLGTGGKITEILPDDDVPVSYNPDPHHHLVSITVWERDTSKLNPDPSGEEEKYEIAWKDPVTITDFDTFRSLYNFEDVNNDYKIKVVYEPSLMKVNYLERETDVVMWEQAQQLTDGKGTPYRVESPDIPGYTLVEEGESQKIVEGIMPDDTYETNVYYTKDPMIGGKITVRKSADIPNTEAVSAGNEITYTLTAVNSGAYTSGTTVVTDNIPEGTEFVEGSLSAGASYADGVVTWNVGTTDAGASKSISYKIKVIGESKSPIYNMATWTTSKEPGTPVHESNLLIHPRSSEIPGPAALESIKGQACSVKTTQKKTGSQAFSYSSNVQTFTAPVTGTYKLEVWGAEAGNMSGSTPAKGGYATGTLDLNAGDTLYVLTGGKGANARSEQANFSGYGFNGGGRGYSSDSGGGGATQITTTNRGTLNNFESYKGEVLVVAGGGGGGEYKSAGGAGGGTSGGRNGGTQTGPGADNAADHKRAGKVAKSGRLASFGLGADGASCSSKYKSEPCYGAGGGGWYGGGTGSYGVGGGGGSGYTNTSRLTATSMSNGQQTGNGRANISWTYDVVTYSNDCNAIASSSSATETKESTITYSVTLRNNGNATSHESVLRDLIPGGTTYVDGSLSIDGSQSVGSVTSETLSYDSSGKQIVAYFGDMPHGASRTVKFSVKVNGKDTLIENQGDFGRDVGGASAARTAALKHKSNIVESYIPGSVTIRKDWDVIPANVSGVNVVLRRSDGATYNGTITSANEWRAVFSGLNLTDYSYTVYETDVPLNYKSSCPQSSPCAVVDGVATITNTSEGKTRLEKIWADEGDLSERPTSVTYNFVGSDGSTISHNLTELDGWAKTVGLPMYSATGAVITYRVYETEIDGYASSAPQESPIPVSIGGTATITNELVRDFSAVKTVTDANDVDINNKVVSVGSNLYYHITFENPYNTARLFTITDELPAETEFVSADNGGALDSGSVSWNLISVDGKTSKTVSFVVRTKTPNVVIPNIANVVIYKADGITPSIEKDTNEVVNYTPGIIKDIKNSKNVSIDTKSVEPGQKIHYEVTVQNPAGTARLFTITDVLDTANLEFISADKGGVNTNGTIRWSDVTVPANGSETVTIYAKVKQNENTEIKNKASAVVELANAESNEVVNWKGLIKISKSIVNYYDEYGTPFFNFEIKDASGKVWTRHIALSNTVRTGTADTFFVPAGLTASGMGYTINELRNARYELKNVTAGTNMAVSNSTGATTISKENPVATISFENEIKEWNKDSHANAAVNSFAASEEQQGGD